MVNLFAQFFNKALTSYNRCKINLKELQGHPLTILRSIQKMMGRNVWSVTHIYTHVVGTQERGVVRLMDGE